VKSVTDQQPVISVRGEAYLEVDPEIAVVSITVQARDRDRRAVLDRLVGRNRQVLDLVREYGDAVEKVESGPASAHPEFKPKGDRERVAGYAGQASARVTVRDLSVLGELVARLAELELVTVAGPWWSLRPDSPVYREARVAAARDATLRAGEYAAAFGGRLGELIEAADTGLLTSRSTPQAGPPIRRARMMAAQMSAGYAEEAPSLDLEPARQSVTAQVEARFAMRPAEPAEPAGPAGPPAV
jgi:uncharacterized protein YggE